MMVLRVFLLGSKEEVVVAVAVFSAEDVEGYWLMMVLVVASVVVLVGVAVVH